MSLTITAIIIGILFGGAWSLLVSVVTKKSSIFLTGGAMIAGAIGAVTANQLVTYGPLLFGINIFPAIVGAIVLAALLTFVFSKVAH